MKKLLIDFKNKLIADWAFIKEAFEMYDFVGFIIVVVVFIFFSFFCYYYYSILLKLFENIFKFFFDWLYYIC